MTQYLRPDSQVTATQIISGTYLDVDEITASDADFIRAEKNEATAVYRMGMSNPTANVPSGTSTLSFRAVNANGTSLSGSAFITMTVRIYEGATLRASTTQVLTASWTTYTWNPDLSAVTDFSNIEVYFGQDAQMNRNFLLSWVRLAVPSSHILSSGSFTLTGGAMTSLAVTFISLAGGVFTLAGGVLDLVEKTFSFGARRTAKRSAKRRRSFSSKGR